MKLNSILILFCLTASVLFTACKKKIDYPAQPNSRIESFKVPVSDGEISGVIDESDKTITVYLPFFYQLDVIDPKIKLAEGAVLKEAVVPVEVMDTKTTYTVTGADKSSSTYKLIINIQQITPLVLDEVSTAATTSKWGIGNGFITVSGNFNTTDVTKVKVYLVGADGKEIALVPSASSTTGIAVALTPSGKTYRLGNLQVPQTVDPGTYKLRAKVYSLVSEAKYPVEIVYGRPTVTYAGVTAKAGETFKIGTRAEVFHQFSEFSIMVKGQKTVLPIISYNRTEAVIRVPEEVPAGVYQPTLKFEGWPASAFGWTVTVTPK
ncbi:hypothetical protein DBR43_01845 [Pedobacter sp. KBW06]|uniref:hypothetical protein n=1 Tax=Pedobacter sp. KBW06 TaxID=2153359 RepID=UPI000F5B2F43|nr:hypothetical protein [Pedobacter sp. KBW06]RQO74167.1 hypothetical protein DBR43_01845 [Pedobacter sp. KBW06]